MASSNNSRALLQFNEYDFRHRKVLEILRSNKRHMTDLVVNAVLHFISCPEAESEFSKELIRSERFCLRWWRTEASRSLQQGALNLAKSLLLR